MMISTLCSLFSWLDPTKPVFPESDSFWMPAERSTVAGDTDWLYFFLYWVSAAATVLVVIAMVYMVVRFRVKKRTSKQRVVNTSDHNTALEITWSVIPLFFLIAFFFYGFQDYMKLRTPPKGAMEVNVQGQKWVWSFTHKNGCSDNVLHVPVKKPVRLVITSVDVLHSVWIPNFRTKMDAVPGRYTDLWFEATQTGEYPLECTEYCGQGHSDMLSKVIVEDQASFDKYLEDCTKIEVGPEAGKKLYEKKGCTACHSTDGTKKVGPSFKGIWGEEVQLTSGTAKVDENYIRESLLEPQAKIVAGYGPVMPTFAGQLKDEEITSIIEYIKTLK